MPSLSVVLKELKDLDYQSYLAAIFSLKKDLSKVASLFLLQNQLKKIHDLTKEDMVGLVRIAWFKEAIEKIPAENKNQNHPLINEIAKFKDELDFDLLKQSFLGFEKDFAEQKKFKNLAELQEYIFQTQEIFYSLILRLTAPNLQKNLRDELSGNLAQIAFYLDLLRRIKLNDETVSRFLFDGFFGHLNVDLQIWQKNADEENLQLIIKYMCSKIAAAVSAIENLKDQLPLSVKGVILKAKISKIYLKKLQKNNFDIFTTNLSAKGFLIKLQLLLSL